MNDPISSPPAAQTPGNTLTFWPRFHATYGPAAVGLFGGALTVGIASVSFTPVLRACGETYAKFPSLQAPWLMRDFTPHIAVLIPLFFVAVAAPFVMGYVSARLVRPKDGWEAVSAGLTTATTASVAAYLLWIGWAVTVATVVVPSIHDLTLFASSTRTPAEATAHPSDLMTGPYPDLKATPADARGDLLFPKIVSDQVVGSAYGVWVGGIVSAAVVGLPAFCGTLAAAWLLRRGGSRWAKLFSYFELTVATAVPLGLLLFAAVPVMLLFGQPLPWLRLAALGVVSAVVVAGVIRRWGWPLRLVAAFAWVMVLAGVGFRDYTSEALIGGDVRNHVSTTTVCATVVGYGGLAVLLVRRLVGRSNARLSPPPAS